MREKKTGGGRHRRTFVNKGKLKTETTLNKEREKNFNHLTKRKKKSFFIKEGN